jgi:hypothetical protein
MRQAMAITVSLNQVIDALMFQTETSSAFVNGQTGEVLICGEDEITAAETCQDESKPQWMREQLPKIREAFQGVPWLSLPSKFDIHEWDMMRRFANQQARGDIAQELQAAIGGAGAFRRFREALSRFRIEQEWYSFRDQQFEDIAREWLAENGFDCH